MIQITIVLTEQEISPTQGGMQCAITCDGRQPTEHERCMAGNIRYLVDGAFQKLHQQFHDAGQESSYYSIHRDEDSDDKEKGNNNG